MSYNNSINQIIRLLDYLVKKDDFTVDYEITSKHICVKMSKFL